MNWRFPSPLAREESSWLLPGNGGRFGRLLDRKVHDRIPLDDLVDGNAHGGVGLPVHPDLDQPQNALPGASRMKPTVMGSPM